MNKLTFSLFSLLCVGALAITPGCYKKKDQKNKKKSHVTKKRKKTANINKNISIDDVKEFLPQDKTEAEIIAKVGKS